MADRTITAIVIHCADTADGVALGHASTRGRPAETAAQVIDRWHADRGFNRATWRLRTRPELRHIGYHFVIEVDGEIFGGRELGEIGAHVRGSNAGSIGICLIGRERFTREQWSALKSKVLELRARWPRARILGHRDFSPDRNFDGRVTRDEWLKTCPGFDVTAWVDAGFVADPADVCQITQGAKS